MDSRQCSGADSRRPHLADCWPQGSDVSTGCAHIDWLKLGRSLCIGHSKKKQVQPSLGKALLCVMGQPSTQKLAMRQACIICIRSVTSDPIVSPCADAARAVTVRLVSQALSADSTDTDGGFVHAERDLPQAHQAGYHQIAGFDCSAILQASHNEDCIFQGGFAGRRHHSDLSV